VPWQIAVAIVFGKKVYILRGQFVKDDGTHHFTQNMVDFWLSVINNTKTIYTDVVCLLNSIFIPIFASFSTSKV
jgi:hypothetical protein